MRKKRCGVYAIKQKSTGTWYIGGSADMVNRFGHHRFMLRNNRHCCKPLQKAWNNSKEDDFEFVELVECLSLQLRTIEDFWLRKIKEKFNLCTGANGMQGFKHSAETKLKMRIHALSLITVEERKKRSDRAKRQHREGKLGRSTWRQPPATTS